jgi:hypothetical protein
MGFMARYRQKSIETAQRILGGEATVLDHAATNAGPNPVLLAGGALALVGAVLAVFHVLVSGVLIFGVAYAINKPRNLVLTDRGLVLFSRSLGGKPASVIGACDASVLTVGTGPVQLGFVPLQLGAERDWIRAKDLQRFLAAGTTPGLAGAG